MDKTLELSHVASDPTELPDPAAARAECVPPAPAVPDLDVAPPPVVPDPVSVDRAPLAAPADGLDEPTIDVWGAASEPEASLVFRLSPLILVVTLGIMGTMMAATAAVMVAAVHLSADGDAVAGVRPEPVAQRPVPVAP